jgi:hypothetical protein
MRVKKIKIIAGGFYIKPENNQALFYHCSARPDCSLKYFDETVRPLLVAHGVKEIRIVD